MVRPPPDHPTVTPRTRTQLVRIRLGDLHQHLSTHRTGLTVALALDVGQGGARVRLSPDTHRAGYLCRIRSVVSLVAPHPPPLASAATVDDVAYRDAKR